MSSGKIFLNAVLAGIFIGIAGTVCMAVPNPVIGAFLFGFGLLTIVSYGFKLYTGAIGYLAVQGRNTPRYLWELLLIWLGNLAGCFAVGQLVRRTRSFPAFGERIANVCAAKLGDSFTSWLILSFFCGILMYVAVESFKRKDELAPNIRVVILFLCVAIFILSGFEHCIANMYYFSAGDVWSWKALGTIGVMTLGNSLGGMLLPAAGHVKKQ
ncbi:MAG: formate/nitrite transporter family protein [Lentisphaeria bacterium]|nr:formate/nitrite transporter family protein [Lentisphaeria bacterium]